VDAPGRGWQIHPPVSGRDPRFRRYRASLWVIYFALVALGVGILVVSVGRALRGPPRRGASGPLPTRAALRVCLADLEALWQEQNERAWALAGQLERPDPFASWALWARDWELRVDDLADRCRLDVTNPREEGYAERTELAAARDALLALHRAYGLHVQRFHQEHGDLAEAAAEALAHARVAVQRAPR
jgi:hypothetical protein